jgi:iron complex outermembrane receptor protein
MSNRFRSLCAAVTTVFVLNITPYSYSSADDNPPATLEKVIVSATRVEQSAIPTPSSITVITRDEISKSGAVTLAQVLRGKGGIQVRDLFGDGSNAVIDMRGFGPTASSNTLIMVDGRTLNNSSDVAAPDLNSIAVSDIERIEIVQGSAGVLYGNQAVGGVINIITSDPDHLRAEARVRAGSYDTREYYASVGDSPGHGIFYRIAVSHRKSSNYRDNNDNNLENLFGRLGYSHGSGKIYLEHQRIYDKLDQPGALFEDELAVNRRQSAAVYANDFSDTDTRVTRLGMQHFFADTYQLDAEYTYRDSDRDFRNSFRAFGAGAVNTQNRQVQTFTPRLTAFFPTSQGDLQLTAGVDLEQTDYELRTSFGPQLVEQDLQSIYAQVILPLSATTSFTAGFRNARIDNDIDTGFQTARLDDDVTVGSFGITYRPAPEWRWFARAEGNYRFAKVDEHTNIVFGQPIGLQTQTGTSYEAGAEWNRGDSRLKVLAYQLILENEISFDASTFYNVNLDETERNGLIIEGQTALNPRLRIGGSYTYTNAEISAGPFMGNALPLVAENQLRLHADYDVTPGTNIFAEMIYVDDQVLGSDFTNNFTRLPDFTVVNLHARHQNKNWTLAAHVNNVFDKKYSEEGSIGYDDMFMLRPAFDPSPERNFWLSVEVAIR